MRILQNLNECLLTNKITDFSMNSFSGVTGRGTVPPPDFWPGNFCWPTGKKWQGKYGKGGKKEGKVKMEGGESSKIRKIRRGSFFFFFFAFHFSKRLKFVLGVPKWKFSTGKKAFHAGKKIKKNDFAPSEKFSCYAPELNASYFFKCVLSCTSFQTFSFSFSMLLKQHK